MEKLLQGRARGSVQAMSPALPLPRGGVSGVLWKRYRAIRQSKSGATSENRRTSGSRSMRKNSTRCLRCLSRELRSYFLKLHSPKGEKDRGAVRASDPDLANCIKRFPSPLLVSCSYCQLSVLTLEQRGHGEQLCNQNHREHCCFSSI